MSSYFKRNYLDDVKLAQRALLEFGRALRSGRLIAFTGAMTTQACGYGTWDQLIARFGRTAEAVCDAMVQQGNADADHPGLRAKARIGAWIKPPPTAMRPDPRVRMGLIEEVLLSLPPGAQTRDGIAALLRLLARGDKLPKDASEWQQNIRRLTGGQHRDFAFDIVNGPADAHALLMAMQFRRPQYRDDGIDELTKRLDERLAGDGGDRAHIDVVRALIHDLGIRRFATLNYDFEIEAQLMLNTARSRDPFDQLRQRIGAADGISWDLQSGRIRRVLIDGAAAESDVLSRERIDRMIEFAVGADDVDAHVLHLHGRACQPHSMIMTYRDYDRLYRTNDLMKLPFEFAQRIMMGGNPILFTGLGMNENEINEALQDFVSASPYQRMAPTFLLWNLNMDMRDLDALADNTALWDEIAWRRLDWFHRLGVLTIFDADVALITRAARKPHPIPIQPGDLDDELKPLAGIHNLALLIKSLPAAAEIVTARENEVGDTQWRSMRTLLTEGEASSPRVIWEMTADITEQDRLSDEETARLKRIGKVFRGSHTKKGGHMLGVIGLPGCGHGLLASALARNPGAYGFNAEQVLLINACFSFDSDGMLDGIAWFLRHHFLAADAQAPLVSRGKLFRDLTRPLSELPRKTESRVLIVVNGMERLFGLDGELLSAEFGELLQRAAEGMLGVSWLFFGTQRMRRYFGQEALPCQPFGAEGIVPSEPDGTPPWPARRYQRIDAAFGKLLGDAQDPHAWSLRRQAFDPAAWRRLDQARQRYSTYGGGRTPGGDGDLRHAFYGFYLGPILDAAIAAQSAGDEVKGTSPDAAKAALCDLARELLRALAFVGLPVAISALAHVPRVAAAFTQWRRESHPGVDKIATLTLTLNRLVELGLVLPLQTYPRPTPGQEPGPFRCALPRSLLTELRYRFSMPLSEAKLSTAFNMSLYTAQPVDGFIPEPEIHDELGEMIDRLIGAYREMDMATALAALTQRDDLKAKLSAIAAHRMTAIVAPHEHESPRQGEAQDARARHGTAPEPAEDEARSGRRRQPLDGKLNSLAAEALALCTMEHGQCLRTALALIRGYYTTTDLLTLDVNDRLIREDRDGILLEHAERLDSLIDIHGKTLLARRALQAAAVEELADDDGARADVAGLDPFFADEIVWLHNERGVVRLAMGDYLEAEASFERALSINRRFVEGDDRSHNWRRVQLNQIVVDTERAELALAMRKIEAILQVSALEHGISLDLREDQLAAAIATGYRARIHVLQGDRQRAWDDYSAAIATFKRLGEHRCLAYFLRMRVEVNAADPDGDLAQALNLALATRQMDIVYRLRVMTATKVLQQATGEARVGAQQALDGAIRYALQTDVHRVRVEAGAAQAEARFCSGDFEGALRHVSDALMIATRFGMELRKIWLRSLAARIMAGRGHPITAQNLALTAIRIASRRRYETAIDHAEATLAQLPRNSLLDGMIDAVQRRQL